jgi:hypothetical protein
MFLEKSPVYLITRDIISWMTNGRVWVIDDKEKGQTMIYEILHIKLRLSNTNTNIWCGISNTIASIVSII